MMLIKSKARKTAQFYISLRTSTYHTMRIFLSTALVLLLATAPIDTAAARSTPEQRRRRRMKGTGVPESASTKAPKMSEDSSATKAPASASTDEFASTKAPKMSDDSSATKAPGSPDEFASTKAPKMYSTKMPKGTLAPDESSFDHTTGSSTKTPKAMGPKSTEPPVRRTRQRRMRL